MSDAVAVFHDHGNHWADRFLRKGFKHVLVVVKNPGNGWILIDPKAGTFEIEYLGHCDPVQHYRSLGYTAVPTTRRDTAPVLPFAYANCVGVAKAVLGLQAPLIFTPYQLYRRLTC